MTVDVTATPDHGIPPPGATTTARLALRERVAKRAVDIVGSTLLLLTLSPLLVLVVILLVIASRRPVLFRQARVRRHGRVLLIWKFRTMVREAEDLRDGVWDQRSQLGESPPPVLFKLRDDPRVTPIGRVLRRWSIDELSQLWNVLRGEMSLVGPRPLPLADHECAANLPGTEGRLVVKPGITGPWQVRGRSDLGVDDMLALDLDSSSVGRSRETSGSWSPQCPPFCGAAAPTDDQPASAARHGPGSARRPRRAGGAAHRHL